MGQESIAMVKEELGHSEPIVVTKTESKSQTKPDPLEEVQTEIKEEMLSNKTDENDQIDEDGVNHENNIDSMEPEVIVENTSESAKDDEASTLELNIPSYKEAAYSQDKLWGVSARYLGILSQIGVEREIFGQISMGLYYGRFQGKVAGSDDLGLIPDLDHVALQVNAYLGEQKSALSTGPVLRFAVHGNKQKNNELVKSVQVDGVDVIVPGKTRVGTLLGVGYHWQWNPISLSVGIEYLSLGPLKNLVPLAASLGVAF
jgi:hypothetical protein